MDRERLFQYGQVILLLLLLYLSFLVVKPFLTYLVLGLVLAYALHPLYKKLSLWLKSERWASFLLVFLVIILLLLPSGLFVRKLVSESVNAYNTFKNVALGDVARPLDAFFTPLGFDVTSMVEQVARNIRDYFVHQAPNIIGSIATVILGAFIMLFLLYAALRHGESWVKELQRSLPMPATHTKALFHRVGTVTDAVIYGQLLTSLVQGFLGGLMFWIFGIPNAVFWGAIMTVAAFIPFFGTPLVWAPAGVIALYQGNYVAGIGVLVVGGVVVMNIDNVLKPWLIGSKARLSTLLVLLGVFGGLALFGFIGLILGPLILALLQTALDFYKDVGAKAHANPAVSKRKKPLFGSVKENKG